VIIFRGKEKEALMTKKLLIVTGGAGFIGSTLLEIICSQNSDDIWVIDSLTYASNEKHIPKDSRLRLFRKSISNMRDMDKLFSIAKANYFEINVIHLAAESHVDRSIKSGSVFIETNVLGTQNLLELSTKFGVKKFVHVSTDEVYGDISAGESTEMDKLAPSSAYAASKSASDLLVLAHVRTHGLDAVITRCTNNFGSTQAPEKFIPRIINRVMNGETIPIYGDGNQVREWIWVNDHAIGILSALKLGKKGEVYNFGSGWRKTNLEIVSEIAETLEIEPKFEFVKDRLGHDRRYAPNSTKAFRDLKWTASGDTQLRFKEVVEDLARIAISKDGKKRFMKMEKFYGN
jgi:dTDP-glucose 4,6-dehydratase